MWSAESNGVTAFRGYPLGTAEDAVVPSVGPVFDYVTQARDYCPQGQRLGSFETYSSGNPGVGRTCP